MKINFFLILLCLGAFATAAAQNGNSSNLITDRDTGRPIAMIPCDKMEAKRIYVGNQPISEVGSGNEKVYVNEDKNIYLSVPASQKAVSQILVHPRLIKMLENRPNLKALIYDGKLQLVNKKGKVVRDLPDDLIITDENRFNIGMPPTLQNKS